MSKIILSGIMVVVAGGLFGWAYMNDGDVVMNDEPQVRVEKVVEVEDALTKRVEAAQEAAMQEIESEAQSAYDARVEAAQEAYDLEMAAAETAQKKSVENGLTEIADTVKADYIKEIEATISADSSY